MMFKPLLPPLRRWPRLMVGPRGLGASIAFMALLVGSALPANAQRRVAVVAFEGSQSALMRSAVMITLTEGYTVLPADQVDAKAQAAGLDSRCDRNAVSAMARTVGAEAVLCAKASGPPFRRKLALRVHNGLDGKLLGQVSLTLHEDALSEETLARIKPQLDKAIAKADHLEAPPEAAPTPVEPSAPPAPVKELETRLRSPVLGDRLSAVDELARHQTWQAAIPLSCALLVDEDANVRERALGHLALLHDMNGLAALRAAAVLEPETRLRERVRRAVQDLATAVDTMAAKLEAADVNTRLAAARAFSQAAYPNSLDHLLKASRDGDPRVRLLAMEGLRYFFEARAREGLAQGAKDTHAEVAKAAASYLEEQQRLAAWRVFYMSYMKVIKKLDARDASWRTEAAIALGLSGADTAANRLVEVLEMDSEAQVRLAASWSLNLMQNERVTRALQRAAGSDASPMVRQAINRFLGADKASPNDLIKLLTDPTAELRQVAAETLAFTPPPEAMQPLVRSALCDQDPHVRVAALRGLARSQTALGVQTIKQQMFRDPSEEVQRQAMMMFVLVGWEEADPEPTVATKETAAWATDQEDPILAERRKAEAEARLKAEADKKKREVEDVPRCPLDCPALRVLFGASASFLRHFAPDIPSASDGGRPVDESTITSTPVAGLGFGLEVYPVAFFNQGWFSNLGVGLRYARFFGLSWVPDNAPDSPTDITQQVLSVDFIRLRWQPVRSERVPTLRFRFGLNWLEFSFNDAEDRHAAIIPDVSITSLVVGLGLDIPIVTAHFMVGFDYLPVLSWGEITEPTLYEDEKTKELDSPRGYGAGSGYGLQGTVGFRGPLFWKLGWQIEAIYNYYRLDFDKAVSVRLANSSQDHYLMGNLFITFNW